ncbi:TraX protein [compost metagenome]
MPYQLALNPIGFNVIGTLFIAVVVLNILDRVSSRILSAGIVILCGMIMEVFPFDYGAYGLILVLIFRYLSSHELVGAHTLLNIVYLVSNGWLIQLVSIIPTIIFVYGPRIWARLESMRVNKWVWRSFYPLHLSLIAIWKWVVW